MLGYDRIAAGNRIQRKRELLGITRQQLAQRIDRSEEFCEEIEKGNRAISVETIIGIADMLHMSLDYMLLGRENEAVGFSDEEQVGAILGMVLACPEEKRGYLKEMIKIYLMSLGCTED